ncbi:MAG: BMC domain-containing protein [Clostridium sp.]
MKAIGIVEVVGVVASVRALDAMTKAASVEFKTSENSLGGRLVTIIVEGKVDDVISSVDVGIRVANTITKCVAHAVIPKPHEEVVALIEKSSKKYN